MKTVTLEVQSYADTMAEAKRAWKAGEAQKSAKIVFATPELLWKVLTAKRWELLKSLCGQGVVGIREAARMVGRDVKGVHTDVTALVNAGVISRKDGGVEFPYEEIRVAFALKASEMKKAG